MGQSAFADASGAPALGQTGAKRWQGLLAGEQRRVRRAVAAILCVLVVAMAAGQLSMFPLGDSHVLLLLVPVSLAALLFGKWRGCTIGALAGLAEMLHAILLPLDYFEKYFSSPLNSIVLFALFGFLMGALFALVCRPARARSQSDEGMRARGVARIGAIVVVSVVGALFASAFLQGGIYLSNTAFAANAPAGLATHVSSTMGAMGQLCADAALIAITCLAADAAIARFSQVAQKQSLRVTFQVWFGALTIVFFLLANSVAFTAMTVISLNNMNAGLSDHLDSLVIELSGRDTIVNTMEQRGALSRDELRNFSAQAYRNIDVDLPGWYQDVVALAADDTVFASNDGELFDASFSGIVNAGLGSLSCEDALAAEQAVEYYQGQGTQISYLLAREASYERLGESGTYQLMAIVPAGEVFLNRPIYMALVAAVFALMFGAIFLLAMRLLNRVVIAPINETNQVLGRITAGELDKRVAESDSAEFSSLSGGINATVTALEASIAEANARIDRELATARAIQESALPSAQPPFPDIDAFDLYATMDPAREVGGDFYDFFELGAGRIGFVVADVSGKGIPAALFMMAAKTAIRGAMEARKDLAYAIGIANRSLCKGNDSEMFVTVFAGVLDYETGKLTYVNAGHNRPLVMRDGVWSWLTARSGPFLGMLEDVEYKKFEMQFLPGDELFAYTDGVIEAFNADEECYGDARLEAFLTMHAELHPRRLLRAVRAELIGWSVGTEQSDDITMLALKYGIPPERGSSLLTTATLENFERVEAFLTRRLDECGCPPKVAHEVLIAAEELVVNVCSYAYPDAPADKPGPLRVHFTWRRASNTIVVEVGDDGVPFNPLEHDDPARPASMTDAQIGGLGLVLAKKLMDEVAYVREGIANVTIITKSWANMS